MKGLLMGAAALPRSLLTDTKRGNANSVDVTDMRVAGMMAGMSAWTRPPSCTAAP